MRKDGSSAHPSFAHGHPMELCQQSWRVPGARAVDECREDENPAVAAGFFTWKYTGAADGYR